MLADRPAPLGTVIDREQHERGHSNELDRRADKRFVVPGSLVRVPARPHPASEAADVCDMPFGSLQVLWTERREVVDLSAGGLAFESRSPIARGRKLRIQLWIAGLEQPLELSAETRWCKRLLGRQYCVGVRFDAFAAQPGHDRPVALDALRQLEAKYGGPRARDED